MKDYILNLDRPRELRFGFKSHRMINQKFGNRPLESLMDNLKMEELPAMVWAGLKWDDKQLTVENVEDLLDAAIPKKYTILEIIEIALEAFGKHLGRIDLKKVAASDQDKKKPEKKKVTETIPSTKKQKK